MNAFLSLDGAGLWLVAGWTMLHFLWVGAIVAGAALLFRLLLCRTAASVRYVTALACLALLALAPFGIFAWLVAHSDRQVTLNHVAANARLDAGASAPIIELHRENSVRAVPPISQPMPAEPEAKSRNELDGLLAAKSMIQTTVAYLPWLWLVGTPITFGLLITGVVGTRRLRRASQPIVDGPIADALAQLTASLWLGGRVTVAVCDRIAAPVLIGILRPMILLPPAAITGWSPDEIEMVLLHELAHVRRWDNLVNLFQRLVESLLFFHPAVWLVSSWVRREREACCDAAVVARTNHPHAYAELLVALAAQMPRSVLFHPAASSAMAAGPLRDRIRRILKLQDDPMLVSGKSFTIILAGVVTSVALAIVYLPTVGQAEESAAKSNDGVNNHVDPAKADDATTLVAQHDRETELLLREISELQKKKAELDSQIHQLHENFTNANSDIVKKELEKFLKQDTQMASFNEQLAAKQLELVQREQGGRGQTSGKALVKQQIQQLQQQIAEYSKQAQQQLFASNEEKPNAKEQELAAKFQSQTDALNEQQQAVDKSLEAKKKALAQKLEASVAEETSAAEKELASRAGRSVEWVREQETFNNLKNLSLALHNFNAADKSRAFPPSAKYSADGKHPLLSWRVLILPYLGERALYDEFHLNESWDSDHNKRLIPRMPKVFKNPDEKGNTGHTNYLAVVGKDCAFDGSPNGMKITRITDGTAHTVALVEADRAVEWTRPAEFTFVPSHPKEGLGKLRRDGWNAAWVDGHVGLVPNNLGDDFVKALLTRNGREVFDLNQPDRGVSMLPATSAGEFVGQIQGQGGPAGVEPSGAPGAGDETAAGPGLAESRDPPVPATGPRSSKFPSLEDQKLADLAYKRLDLELEPISVDELKRVKALGYDGGVKITAAAGQSQGHLQPGQILVGLHVWPTTSLKDVAQILQRDDLNQLNPLKFYVIFNEPVAGSRPDEVKTHDIVRTGRISVNVDAIPSPQNQAPSAMVPAERYPLASPRGWSPVDSAANQPFPTPASADAYPTAPASAPSAPLTPTPATGLIYEPSGAPNPYIPRVKIAPPSPEPDGTGVSAMPQTPRTALDADNPFGGVRKPALSAPVQPAIPTLPQLAQPIEPSPSVAPIAPQAPDQNNPFSAGPTPVPSAPPQPTAPTIPQPTLLASELVNAPVLALPGETPPVIGKENSRPLYLAFFYHPSNADAKRKFENQFQELKRQYPELLGGATINVEKDVQTAEDYQVTAVPQYILYNNRKEVARVVGVQPTQYVQMLIAKAQKSRGGATSQPPAGPIPLQAPVVLTLPEDTADSRVEVVTRPLELAMREQPFFLMFFYSSDGQQPLKLFEQQLKELRNKRKMGIAVIDVKTDSAIAKNYKVDKTPTYVLFHNGAEFARMPGERDTAQLLSAIFIEENSHGKPDQAPSGQNRSMLRYDGKTFDNWRDAWQKELSTDKRLEAVKALAAFGANGYGKEAAEAILEVAGQYDWTILGNNAAVHPLQTACIEAFAGDPNKSGGRVAIAQGIAPADSLPVLREAAKSGNGQQLLFLTRVLPSISGPESVDLLLQLSKDQDPVLRKYAMDCLPPFTSPGHNEKVAARIREALNSNDSDEVFMALGRIWPYVNAAAGKKPYPYLPEVTKALFSPHELVRKRARQLAETLQGENWVNLVNDLLAILDDKSRKDQHLEAVRALAAMRPRTQPPIDKLVPLMKSKDERLAIAATAAAHRVVGQGVYNTLVIDAFGERFDLKLNGEMLMLPGGSKQGEWNEFDSAIKQEERQLFP
jgi:beta-lactamase regulating signal transducer with metallopeptidase domain/thioredoxin-like negative regulator of GroEL